MIVSNRKTEKYMFLNLEVLRPNKKIVSGLRARHFQTSASMFFFEKKIKKKKKKI